MRNVSGASGSRLNVSLSSTGEEENLVPSIIYLISLEFDVFQELTMFRIKRNSQRVSAQSGNAPISEQANLLSYLYNTTS